MQVGTRLFFNRLVINKPISGCVNCVVCGSVDDKFAGSCQQTCGKLIVKTCYLQACTNKPVAFYKYTTKAYYKYTTNLQNIITLPLQLHNNFLMLKTSRTFEF